MTAPTTPRRCPLCHGVVERTSGDTLRTICPAFYRSADDLRQELVTVVVLACTACEWVAEAARVALFTSSADIEVRDAQ
jgi:hypothetical protein